MPTPGGGRRRRIGLRVLAIVVLYVLWELTARVTRNPTFIPAPSAVWHQLVQTSTAHDGVRGYSGHLLIEHLGVSLRRILIGSVIGVAAGLVLGIALGTVAWRSTAHYANRDYGATRRVMHRITLRGDVPVGPRTARPVRPEEAS